MLELAIEILVYLAIAALIGFLLGYLAWGWGLSRKLDAARTEGVASVRTSMHGDSANENQLAECQKQRKRLELSLERSKDQIRDLQTQLEEARAAMPAEAPESPLADPVADVAEALDEDGADDIMDAEIDLPAEPEDAEPAPAARRLFKTDNVDPRISGIEPEPDPDPQLGAQTETEADAASDVTFAIEAPPEAPAPVPELLLTERPEEVDDLKEIKGVGRVMEGVLNDKGVYLFHQIANFSDADVAWVNEAIEAFPGRIERDNWVGQAQDLYRAKYGKAHDT